MPYSPYYGYDEDKKWIWMCDEYGDYHDLPCPYGKPGDQLWLRETWVHYQTHSHVKGFYALSDGSAGYKADGFKTVEEFRQHILVTCEDIEAVVIDKERWKPSIHMPRWASRINLLVKDVRVERVQDITEDGARAEGITVLPLQEESDPSAWWESSPGVNQARSARQSFIGLWDSINEKRGYGWDVNSWVWVVEFEVVG